MDASSSAPTVPVACRTCGGRTIRWGKDRAGHRRHLCKVCGATFAVIPPRPLGAMRLDPAKATLCLSLLTEGNSIRSTERVTGVHRDTIMRLLVLAGEKAAALLDTLMCRVAVKDVQADEIWSFIGMKEKTKHKLGIVDDKVGDAYTFVAIERSTKVVLSHHLGRRTSADAGVFMAKLETAVSGEFQMTTDGFNGYPGAVEQHFGAGIDFAQLIKTYGKDLSDDRRYSPPAIIGIEAIAISGDPEESRVCTSHVERQNLHIRMQMRRFTRLTNGFSKKWENLRAALALHFWSYNFCWMHSTIRCTPAMAAGVARKPLRVGDLLAA